MKRMNLLGDRPHGWLINELFYQPYRNPEGNKEKLKSMSKLRPVYLLYIQLKLLGVNPNLIKFKGIFVQDFKKFWLKENWDWRHIWQNSYNTCEFMFWLLAGGTFVWVFWLRAICLSCIPCYRRTCLYCFKTHLTNVISLQLGRHEDALDFAVASHSLAPLKSEAAERVENVKKDIALGMLVKFLDYPCCLKKFVNRWGPETCFIFCLCRPKVLESI